MATKNTPAAKAAAAKAVATKAAKAAAQGKPASQPVAKAAPAKTAKPSKQVAALTQAPKTAPVELEEETSGSVTRLDLATDVRERLRQDGFAISLPLAQAAVVAFERSIEGFVGTGREVNLPSFGKFKTKRNEACEKRNPATGDLVEVPAKVVPIFKPGSALKQAAAKLV